MTKRKFVKGVIADGRISDTWIDRKLRLFYYESIHPIKTREVEGTTIRGLKRVAKQMGMKRVFISTYKIAEVICEL